MHQYNAAMHSSEVITSVQTFTGKLTEYKYLLSRLPKIVIITLKMGRNMKYNYPDFNDADSEGIHDFKNHRSLKKNV